MEVFLAEYGLSTEEGVALMCLAEALLRVPDAETVDALIEDKIAPSDWGAHLGQSSSPLVNASTWALMLTGRSCEDDPEPGVAGHAARRGQAAGRAGDPHRRRRAMREMGRQFVLGEDHRRGGHGAARAHGGEGLHLFLRHAGRGGATGGRRAGLPPTPIPTPSRPSREAATHDDDIRDNPGISVKLSALHPRYEESQPTGHGRAVPRLRDLARHARAAPGSGSTSTPRRPTGWTCRST
jgi:RHH-type proline utilization regulon transcriptional repressor/proline dehydrogenase/delta 1-pyrroline-5-carboxylate dehydrogenase